MRVSRRLVLFALILNAFAQSSQQTTPNWAYALNPDTPATTPKSADDTPLHLPNSGAAFTRAQVKNLFRVPDWHPSGHPAMPESVSHGRQPDVYACGYCHLPNGLGRPENASLAGLPTGYIARQIEDFRTGARKTSEPRHLPATNMAKISAHAYPEEVATAAKYFSNLPRKPWIRVVETATVPKTHVAGWMLVADTPASTEPIGQRIIEMPENLERTELRDDTSGFVAYVPDGSLAKGKALVSGREGIKACGKCHGPGLRGSGNAPSIAGRSPSYIVRQLCDFQSGARAGALSRDMRTLAAKLQLEDMVAIAGYLASMRP